MLDRWGKSDEKVLDEGIAAIKSESEYMKKLVDQLLFLARGDMGRSRLDMKLLNVSELVKEVYEDSQLIDRHHDWRIDTEENVLALADRDMLKQCCRVLCDNATKYTPDVYKRQAWHWRATSRRPVSPIAAMYTAAVIAHSA